MATSSNHQQASSTRPGDSHQKWERMKPEIRRMYVEEGMSVEDTISAIRQSYGFALSKRMFYNKIKDWGYQKNTKSDEMQWIVAKRKRRSLEGKDTMFFISGHLVATEKIDRTKRIRTMNGPLNISMPETITYHTPIPESEPSSPQAIHNEWEPNYCSRSQSSSFYGPSLGVPSPIGGCDSQESQRESPQVNKFDVPQISMLDRYVSDELEPYSSFRSSYHLHGHETVFAKQQQMCEQISEILGHCCGEISRLEICCIDNQFLLESEFATGDSYISSNICSIIGNERLADDGEAESLQKRLDIEVTLATYRKLHGEIAPQTLKQRFKLAKAVGKSGILEEVEYHCRIILDNHPQIEVQTFLGMAYTNASRLKEANLLLFSALTEFIIQFPRSSIKENSLFFSPIEELFIDLIRRDDNRWDSLTTCLIKMSTTIKQGTSKDDIDSIPPQLFICGYSFAHECVTLGFINSAMYIYRRLFETPPVWLEPKLPEIENAKAHRSYGLLLIQQNDWISSAEQLALAYISLRESGIQDYELIAALETDYIQLVEHETSSLHEESSLARRLRDVVNHYRALDLPRAQELSADIQGLPIEHYLSSDELPIQLSTVEPSAVLHVARYGLYSRANEVPRSEGYTSIESIGTSVSHPIGSTFSGGSESSMVSNMCFMVQ